jgi:hypothetical protein
MRLGKARQGESAGEVDQVRISSEARRMRVVEQVASEILVGLASKDEPTDDVEREIYDTLSKEHGQTLTAGFDRAAGRFQFEAMDPVTGVSQRLEAADNERMNARLVEITEEIVDRTMVKGARR